MAIQNLGKEPSDAKSTVPRQRKVCKHCGKLHNLHKDVPSGCRFSKIDKVQKSTSSLSSKMPKRTTSSTSDQSSESEESENGDDDPPGILDDGSRSVSLYSPSKGSDDEEEPPPTSHNRLNIVNGYMNEDSEPVGKPTASFHDYSSYLSSVDDQLMPDLYDSSDESECNWGSSSDSEEDEEELWTVVDLVGPRTGKFASEPPAFPRYTPNNTPGPIYLPPCTSFSIDFLHLYFDIGIMKAFVENTNLCGERYFISKSKILTALIRAVRSPTSNLEFHQYFVVILQFNVMKQLSIHSKWCYHL